MSLLLDIDPVSAVGLLAFYLPVAIVAIRATLKPLPERWTFYPATSGPAQRLLNCRHTPMRASMSTRRLAAQRSVDSEAVSGARLSAPDEHPAIPPDWFVNTPSRRRVH